MKNALLRIAGWAAGWLPSDAIQQIYQFKPAASLIRKILNIVAPHGLTSVTVAGGGLAGVKLVLDLQSEKDYWLGSYEPELQAAVRDWMKPGIVVYDVGANIGYLSLLMARQIGDGGRVFAFEALPANVERLRLNLESSGLGEGITVVSAAVVDVERPVKFLVGVSGGMGKAEGSAGRQQLPYKESIEVQGISLDQFVFEKDNPPPGLVKIDIEGGEVLALPGMRRVLHECHPIIFLELHGPEAAQISWKELVSAGYRICRIQRGYPEATSIDSMEWKAYIVAYQ
jgi:FkbM family methyltransferase